MFNLITLGAYLLGGIPVGLIIGYRTAGLDVRTVGSGNIGATNVARAAGRTWGLITLALDFLKGLLPTAAAGLIWPEQPELAAAAGLSAVVGHCFPVYLGFRGGKGVAVSLGVFAWVSPLGVLIGGAVCCIMVALTGYVSLGSMGGALAGWLVVVVTGSSVSVTSLTAAMVLLILIKHRTNIRRLINGRENRFPLKGRSANGDQGKAAHQ